MGLFKKPEDKALNEAVEAQISELEAIDELLEKEGKKMADLEAKLIKYMIENKISELTVGDTVVKLELGEELDIDKMKEDGNYDRFVQ